MAGALRQVERAVAVDEAITALRALVEHRDDVVKIRTQTVNLGIKDGRVAAVDGLKASDAEIQVLALQGQRQQALAEQEIGDHRHVRSVLLDGRDHDHDGRVPLG